MKRKIPQGRRLNSLKHKFKKFWIKFATVAPEGSTWMKHMRRLDQTLKKKSKGEIGFRIYAGQIAGDEVDVLKKIRIGQLHCAAFSGVGLGQVLPMVRVLDLPFLFRTTKRSILSTRSSSLFLQKISKRKALNSSLGRKSGMSTFSLKSRFTA